MRTQFLSEAILSAILAAAVGVGVAVLSTAVYTSTKGWTVVLPFLASGGGFGAELLVGAVAGLLTAFRAARISPTEALWTE